MERFVKLVNKSCVHNGFHLKEGLNVDTAKFDAESPCSGGIYFCREAIFYKWLHYRDDIYYIFDATPADDAQICEEDDKLKTDKLILLNRRRVADFFLVHPEYALPAVVDNGTALRFITNQPEDVCIAAGPEALRHVKNQSDAVCMAAVSARGDAVRHVRLQTLPICMAAVRQDGEALQYIRIQTPALCMAAVQQNGMALKYVLNPTDAIRLAAVLNDPRALYFVPKPTPNLCDSARRRYSMRPL